MAKIVPLKLSRDTLEIEIETEAGTQTLAWEIGPASMAGAWAREDYRAAALADIQAGMDEAPEPEEGETAPTDWERMGQAERRAWLFHLWTGSALAGATTRLSLDGAGMEITPATLIALPQAILERAVSVAYRHNPNWRPGYTEDRDPN